jgi:hypothetical protein
VKNYQESMDAKQVKETASVNNRKTGLSLDAKSRYAQGQLTC